MEQFSDQMETRGPCVSPGGHAPPPRQVEQIVLGSTGSAQDVSLFFPQAAEVRGGGASCTYYKSCLYEGELWLSR